ncbi:MAG: thiol:disulfide interchange protein DsbA/DsbL [Burkholderiaceae bacterium]
MKRRHFSALAAASLGLGARTAVAQGTPVAGQDYKVIANPSPPATPAGTVEVVEFFSFACPHCFEFEPALEAWLARKPAGVHFRRSPVPFLQNAENFQRTYFALEALGQTDTVPLKVFNAFQLERQRLDKPADIAALVARNGVDPTRFLSAFNSFGVNTKLAQARDLMNAYGVDSIGVPALAVQGRWVTSPKQAKGATQALAVVDYLVGQARAGR